MHIKYCWLNIWIAAAVVRAALNEPCYGAGGAAGMLRIQFSFKEKHNLHELCYRCLRLRINLPI